MRRSREPEILPALIPQLDSPLGELNWVEQECWNAIAKAKAGPRPNLNVLVGLFDQIRIVQGDKLKLIEWMQTAIAGPPPGWEELRDRIIAVLQEHPAALEARVCCAGGEARRASLTPCVRSPREGVDPEATFRRRLPPKELIITT
jgi:hypothetical protein